jgi:hypothetical protein
LILVSGYIKEVKVLLKSLWMGLQTGVVNQNVEL